MSRVSILDVEINSITMLETIQRIAHYVKDGASHTVLTANAEMVIQAQTNPVLKNILKTADIVTPDGAGILWASAKQGCLLPEKVSGIDLIQTLFFHKRELKYYLFGASPGVVEKARDNLCKSYPGLNIVGLRHGYFLKDETSAIIDDIKKVRPDVLLVGLGVPAQEIWIHTHKDVLNVPVCIGVGGSFDVLAGNLKRAPEWMRANGLEWLYRLWLQPKRVTRIMALPQFVLKILLNKIH